MVRISKDAFEGIVEHAEEGFPLEVCGVLIGKGGDVATYRRCRNLNTQRAHDRYELDPLSFQEADDWARGSSQEILGVYHSHPDHPSIPSETDRGMAWPEWIYLIVSINSGRYNDAHAWMLRESDSQFEEVELDTV